MDEFQWIREFPAEITVCDSQGILLEMNDRAARALEKDGGRALIGKNILDCHPEPARSKTRSLVGNAAEERVHDRKERRQEAYLSVALVPQRRVCRFGRTRPRNSFRNAALRALLERPLEGSMKRFFNFTKVQPIPAGVYQKQSGPQDQPPYRVHLRLQPDGSGVMVVNAATVLHLNPTAAECAYHFIKGTEPEVAAREIAARYRVSKATALDDFRDFADRVGTLVTTPDLDPEIVSGLRRISPHSGALSAPLRLDCALTYRLPAGTEAEYAPTKRVERELETAEWFQILDKAWQVGIPHVTFTGGEATLRDDLVELVAHAEAIGQVCGLLTDGLKLADKPFRDGLLQAGLDHILLILQPSREASWTALETILREDIFVTAHLTVSQDNLQAAASYLERLASSGRQIPVADLRRSGSTDLRSAGQGCLAWPHAEVRSSGSLFRRSSRGAGDRATMPFLMAPEKPGSTWSPMATCCRRKACRSACWAISSAILGKRSTRRRLVCCSLPPCRICRSHRRALVTRSTVRLIRVILSGQGLQPWPLSQI